MEPENQKITTQLSPQWRWLVGVIANSSMPYGEARIIFHQGQPIEVVELLRRQRFNDQK